MIADRTLTDARHDILPPAPQDSSSASYCAAPQVLLVNTVNLTLFPDNQTLEIALSAGSVESDVNVTIGVDVIAYSKSLLSFSLDLCSIAGGLLCPLPTYQFTGEQG